MLKILRQLFEGGFVAGTFLSPFIAAIFGIKVAIPVALWTLFSGLALLITKEE